MDSAPALRSSPTAMDWNQPPTPCPFEGGHGDSIRISMRKSQQALPHRFMRCGEAETGSSPYHRCLGYYVGDGSILLCSSAGPAVQLVYPVGPYLVSID